jgi:predicted transcriptional regulator
MGASSNKVNNELALGQFGEGMKLYLLILLKSKNPVYIESGDLYYGPSLKNWQYEYKNGKVLYVHIKKRSQAKDNTVVTIDNITKDTFNSFRYICLSLVKDY